MRGGHGSEVAGPICRDVLREVQRRDPGRQVPSADALAELPMRAWPAPPRSDGPGG